MFDFLDWFSKENILNLFTAYGYWVVFFGSLIEGESVILTAGYLASLGKLNIYWIMLIAFVGTLIADQGSFYLGHHYGRAFIEKRTWLKQKSDRVIRLLHRYDVWFIIAMRFIYGIRIAGPIIIGSSGLAPRRFVVWNILSAAIWSVLSCSAGYFLGETIEWAKENTEYLALSVTGLIVFIFLIIKAHKWLMEKFK